MSTVTEYCSVLSESILFTTCEKRAIDWSGYLIWKKEKKVVVVCFAFIWYFRIDINVHKIYSLVAVLRSSFFFTLMLIISIIQLVCACMLLVKCPLHHFVHRVFRCFKSRSDALLNSAHTSCTCYFSWRVKLIYNMTVRAKMGWLSVVSAAWRNEWSKWCVCVCVCV